VGINYSPKIVTDGLALCLDAANPLSYTSGDSVWKDLSGLNNNATMYGTVPVETDITKCWNFATVTGAGAYSASMGFTFVSNMVTRTGDFTFSCWVKNPNASLSQTSLFSNAGGGDGYRFGVGLTGIYYLIGPPYTETNITFLSSLESSKWYNVVTIFKRSTSQIFLYLNGIYQRTGSMPANQTIMQNSAPGIVRGGCCGLYTGKLAQFSVYNSILDVSDIYSNYLATKGRFGL
jgi:hypothetical protein